MADLQFNQRFDNTTKLMYVNNIPSVMHCHHYTTNFIDLALQFEEMGAVEKMINAAEDSFFLLFKKYFITEKIESKEDKKQICEEMYAALGLGAMKIKHFSEKEGSAELHHSHIDEGWLKKFGKIDRPINFITLGFLKAVFNTIFSKTIRAYKVIEEESLVLGAEKSRFSIQLIEVNK